MCDSIYPPKWTHFGGVQVDHGSYGSSRRNVLVEVDQIYRWTWILPDPQGRNAWGSCVCVADGVVCITCV